MRNHGKASQALRSLETTNNWTKRDVGYGSVDDQCSDASMWIRLGVFEGVGADFGDEKAPMFREGIDTNINIQT